MPDYNIFNPEQLDVEQWVLAAKGAGARFAPITATHETGFAIYQSDVNPYSMKALKYRDGKGDLLRDFVDACRKHGIKPGVYIGIRWNSFFGVHNFKVEGTGVMQKNRQEYYNKMAEGMVKEICTNYGPLFEIWFDGGASSPEKGADALFYHNDQVAEARWGGSESGTVGYPCWATFPFHYTGSGEGAPKQIAGNRYALLKHGDSLGTHWMPAMADAPLRGFGGRHEWFWEPGDEKYIYPLEELMDIYYKSVGRNSTLIMGATPDNRGLMPETDVKRLKEWGDEIKRRFEKPIASTSGKGNVVTMKLSRPVAVNQFVIQENIAATGHAIKNFRIDVLLKDRWKTIYRGTAVGHKHIYLSEQSYTTRNIRLVTENSFETPDITNFSVYHVTK